MGAWAGPFLVAALLLTVAGGLKAYDPTTTAGALRQAGLAVPPVVVRIGGALEVVVGLAAIVTGALVPAALVALSYLLFTAFVLVALRRHIPIGSCGCFGKTDTPPSPVHVVLNLGAVVAAVAVALGPGGGIRDVLADQVLLGLPFLVFVATATYLAFLALTLLPQLRALEAPRPRVSRRLAERAATFLAARSPTRRSFLQKTALVSTALAVVPKSYIFRPGSAYSALCACGGQNCACGSQCCDGYTEFCCTITGKNVCPPGTVAAGWWKADGSQFCNGARYYVDCNATCHCGGGTICPDGCSDAPWGCSCAQGNCNNRKAGCTAFRYGQCNQQLGTVGRIACRVVSCDPAVLVAGNCAPTLAVDNSTANHNRPCLQAVPEPDQEDDMFRVIRGDKSATMWLTNWLEKRHISSPAEVNAIVAAGVTQGAPPIVWPQVWVDAIPVRE